MQDNQSFRNKISFLRDPLLLIPFILGATSIGSLLIYFHGLMEFGRSVQVLLLPGIVLLTLFTLWAKKTQRRELYDRILAGLWAGGLATLAYDVVRVPIVMGGVPVFKAISYFGTVMVQGLSPTLLSEVCGWTYHFSNGIGFGLMYTVMVTRPRWWTAVLWGLFLEGMMLLTPYAEVFGYKLSSNFLWITIGSHVVYGLLLWATLKFWLGGQVFGQSPKRSIIRLASIFLTAPIGIGLAAYDFHVRHAQNMPLSPPGYIGPHLYTTWNVLEPDRVVAMWIQQRFIDPKSRFHLIPPFSVVRYGKPFDIPEAEIRRSGSLSVTEVLLQKAKISNDEKLDILAKMTHLYEISPWMIPSDRQIYQLGQEIKATTSSCESTEIKQCVDDVFQFLDQWYEKSLSVETNSEANTSNSAI